MGFKYPAWKTVAILVFLCALTAELFQHVFTRSEEGRVRFAQEQVLALEENIKASLETISTFTTDSQYNQFFVSSRLYLSGFSFFHFENGVLRHWSDNKVSLPEDIGASKIPDGQVLHLSNGIFEAFEKSSGGKKIIGLILLRREFSYENKYLQNHYNNLLGLDEHFEIASGKGDYILKSASGNTLLELTSSHVIPDVLPFKAPAGFYLAAFVLFALALALYFSNRHPGMIWVTVAGIFLFLLRWAMIAWRFPGELYYNDFFSPKAYASSYFFNSIGDLFLNSVTLIAFSGIVYTHSKARGHYVTGSTGSYFFLCFLLPALLLLFIPIHFLLSDLVLNSKISFDTNISALNADTLTAVVSMMLLQWSYVLVVAGILVPFKKILFGESAATKFSLFRTGLLILLVLSFYTSVIIVKNLDQRSIEDQKLFAQRLDSRQDQLAEYLFTDIQERIENDSVIPKIILRKKDAAEKILARLQQNYFTGYFTKFNISVSVMDSSGLPLDSSAGSSLSTLEETFDLGRPTTSESLMLLADESGKLRYLSMIQAMDSAGSLAGTIAIFLDARAVEPSEGFPELLVSNAFAKDRNENTYSYARYSNGSLIFAGGSFPYAFNATAFSRNSAEHAVITMDEYVHVVFRPSADSIIVVSRPSQRFFDQLSFFSYVFVLFLAGFLSIHLLKYLPGREKRIPLSLKQRIRYSIIGLVVISFVLIVAGTSVYIIRKYDEDKTKDILSRLNSMWFALTDRMNFNDPLSSSSKNDIAGELNAVVAASNLDFNLYDETGNLFYSSQAKLFDQGILSGRINPRAFYEMQHYGRTQYVQSEHAGKLTYAAAYAALTDRAGNISGYLNLPYFEKQNELNKEISGFLSALINIYLLLLVVSIFLALIITSRITQPLLLIQEKLSSIRLGSRNETIEWKRNDEIGQLVRQYNMMVEALAESAKKLARSERETAWREMAQQVAHEIKNPLTPMKLSIQHLQRAWNEKSGNLDELFQRISKTMVEQIDALSNIASEFSNFAQMPRAKNETLDMNNVVRSSVNLFNDTGVSIRFNDDGMERIIFADREQLIRVMSNLVKNAVQAIPSSRKGEIVVSVYSENNFHIISVADNGSGIPANLQSKIFTPSFTTKSSGMGLGLAMVKSAVEAMGGTIGFETKEGDGSVFRISIPQVEQPE